MKPFLLPCPSCARHVRLDSAVCPFCDHRLPAWFATRRPSRTQRRTTRAGGYAHTAAASLLAIASGGCGGIEAASTADGGDATLRDGAEQDASIDSMFKTHYGGPPPVDATLDFGVVSDAAADALATDVGVRDAGPDVLVCNGQVCTNRFACTCCPPNDAGLHCCCPAPPYGGATIEDW